MEFLNEFVVPIVCGICLCVGYVLKKWIRDIDNKYIPTVLAIVGLVLSVWINGWVINPSVMLQGLLSGLSATGLHQAFTQYLEKKEGVK